MGPICKRGTACDAIVIGHVSGRLVCRFTMPDEGRRGTWGPWGTILKSMSGRRAGDICNLLKERAWGPMGTIWIHSSRAVSTICPTRDYLSQERERERERVVVIISSIK